MNQQESPVYFADLQPLFTGHGLPQAGATALEAPTTLPFYENWLDQGFAGDMEYLHRHLPAKKNPRQIFAAARSVISVAVPYFPHPYPPPAADSPLRTALYAQGEDYHFWMKEKLEMICEDLQTRFPDEAFKAFVDSGPILERDYAQKAGLGWIGKNSCLIHQQTGSLYFLGEIFTTLKIVADSEFAADRCGTCTRCLDICPTQALVEPRVLDATKCISYLTIEARSLPPEELRRPMGDWFFGCDLCQTVCPWNQRIWKDKLETEPLRPLADRRSELVAELRQILTSSNRQLEKRFRGSALLRARPRGLKRNAMIVAANQQLHELRDVIESFVNDAYLSPLAEWALRELR